MKILILEDEQPAARRLISLIKAVRPETEVAGPLESIEETLQYLETYPEPDLYMMDIQLADGLSFELFKLRSIERPVIFTTAFDEYAIQAFKVNSIDYLLKPLEENALEQALTKYEKKQELPDFKGLLASLQPRTFRQRFLLKKGERLVPLSAEKAAWFQASGKRVVLMTHDKESFVMDETLDQLEQEMDPKAFYRANRAFLISIASVKEVRMSLNGKLNLLLFPKPGEEEVSVSRDKASAFKEWLGN